MPKVAFTIIRGVAEVHRWGEIDRSDANEEEYAKAQLRIAISVNGADQGEYDVDLKATVGGNRDLPFEISSPHGYSGPFDYGAFRTEIEKYYREQGPRYAGGFISFGGIVDKKTGEMINQDQAGIPKQGVKNRKFGQPTTFEIDVPDERGIW